MGQNQIKKLHHDLSVLRGVVYNLSSHSPLTIFKNSVAHIAVYIFIAYFNGG